MPEVDRAVPCATCGSPVDPARAPAVRLTSAAAYCFCSQEHCDRFVVEQASDGAPPREETRVETMRPPESKNRLEVASLQPTEDGAAQAPTRPVLMRTRSEAALPLERRAQRPAPYLIPRPVTWSGTALAAGALLFAFVAVPEAPLGELSLLVLVLAALALFAEHSSRLAARHSERACDRLLRRLSGWARVIIDDAIHPTPAEEVRPGEEVALLAGEVLLVDGSVLTGSGEVIPWEGAEQTIEVHEGTRLCAGAELLRGDLRLICTASGDDRNIAGLVRAGGHRLDRAIQSSRIPTRIALLGGPGVGALAAFATFALGAPTYLVLATAAAGLGCLSSPLLVVLAQATARRWLFFAASEGILYRSFRALDEAAAVSTAVFCSRGTVLHGEPEVTEIHALREQSEEEVLALAAGAETVIEHPVATSVLRAAHDRSVTPDASRSHQATRGMGVVCVSSRGEPLVVGSRELLLRERISIARAEETLRSLESRGRTGLLIAEAGQLVGIISLHDGFRPGAKASVQLLLDAGVEPVLLSGEARHTVEAVARALAIEHVRPEVPANQRAEEIRNLEAGGALVATVGTSPRDDGALSAAHVPIVLDGATLGSRLEGVTVLSNRTVAAAKALIYPKNLQNQSLKLLAVGYLPAALGYLATTTLLVPALTAPLFALLGHAGAFFLHQRSENDPSGR